MAKYAFGYSMDDAVECPMLDEFRAELAAVCRKYGVSIGGAPKLVRFVEGDQLDDLVGNLADADRSIPWLREARRAYESAVNIRNAARKADEYLKRVGGIVPEASAGIADAH